MEPCGYRMNCGHVCPKVCHPVDQEHVMIKCKKKCNKENCELGHKCLQKCHDGVNCGPCLERVKKIVPDCQHEQTMHCSVDPGTFACQSQIEKLLDCGHTARVACSATTIECCETIPSELSCGHIVSILCPKKDDDDIECTEACTMVLECGHWCTGDCRKCKQGRLHIKCTHKCTRELVCSHICQEPCSRECPPCREDCINWCAHSKCPKRCGEICSPCMEPCRWKCDHLSCSMLCHQPCDRQPCNEPCQRLLECEHPCIGLCREKCPKLCRVCNKEEVEEIFFGNEDEEGARFLQLMDCDHCFEVGGLDEWMKTNDDTEEKSIVALKVLLQSFHLFRNLCYGA